MGRQLFGTGIERAIEEKVGEVRTDALDFSFGEIISLYRANPRELEMSPDFQRYFRWSEEQQSRLIESIVLELPIPQIFVIENANGVIELIDGLQRISSVMHFIDSSLLAEPNNTPLILKGCDIIPELNGKSFDEMPLSLRLRIKRSSVRAVVIKRQSTSNLRYSMFKRLNTGGSHLSAQEIRNCTSRMAGEQGAFFYGFLQRCAKQPDFIDCIEAQSSTDQRQDEELVLRFFALKNDPSRFKGHVQDWLDDYMEAVVFGKTPFQYDREEASFCRLFRYIRDMAGAEAFVRYRDGKPIGGLAPAYYEAVSVGTLKALDAIETTVPKERVKAQIIDCLQSEDFRAQVGSSANTMPKLKRRIEIIQTALEGLVR